MNISKDTIREALANVCELTGLRGRWETLQKEPLVVCDTGHNVGGWNYLSKQIAAERCKTRRIVFGMVDDKDVSTVMRMLPKDATFYWTQAETHRAIPAQKISELAEEQGIHGEVFTTVKDAYIKALEDADKDDFVFVGGSSYVVADLLTFLSK